MTQITPLSEAITFQRGFDLPASQRKLGKYPVVTSNGMATTHNEFKVKGPGVVIGRSGSIGGGQYITEDFWPLNTTLWVKDFKNNNEKFIYYLLKSLDFSSFNAGAAVPTLNRNHLSALKVIIPDRIRQDKIADILGTIDEKIEINQQINETLKQTGLALFRQYFIDNQKAAAWDRVSLSELCENIGSGGTPSTRNENYYDGNVLWYSTKELNDGFLFSSEKTITSEGLKKSAAKLFPTNTVTMAIYAAPTVGRLGILTSEASFNQATCGLVAKPNVGYEFIYLYLLLSRVELNNMANGAAQQNISVGKVREFKVINPDNASLTDFRKKIGPIFEQIKDNTYQIQTLTLLRDSLLPGLISGKVRI